jgi:hypothetical protein
LAVDKEEFQGTDQMPMHSFPSTCSVSLVVVLVPLVGFGVFGFCRGREGNAGTMTATISCCVLT